MVNTIKNLVKIELILIVLTTVALFFAEPYLPIELQGYLASSAESIPVIELIALMALLVVALAYLVSLFGLLAVKIWARKVCIYSTILMFSLLFFTGPSVGHAITYTLEQLSVLIHGMILSLLIYDNSYREAALKKSNNLKNKNAISP